jgi:signal transduction histidine kinase
LLRHIAYITVRPAIRRCFFTACLAGIFTLNITAQELINDLQRELSKQKNDTSKVNILNDLGWEYSSLDAAKADSFSKAALELSLKLKFIKGRSSAYNTLGLVCLDKNEIEKAVSYFKLSVADKEKLGQEKGKATVLSNLGIAYKTMGRYKEALNVYEQALKTRMALNDLKGQGDSYNNIGNVYLEMGELGKAEKYFEEAAAIRKKINDYVGLAQAYNNLGAICDDRGEYQKHLDYSFRAATLLDSLNVYYQLPVIYANISRVNKTLGNYDAALQYAKKSAELSRQISSESSLIGAYICMADVYDRTRENRKAHEYYRMALDLIEKGNNTYNRSYCYNALARCFEEEGKPDDAKKFFEKALEAAREYGNKREILGSLCNTIRFSMNRDKSKNIAAMLEEALHIAKEENYGDPLKRVYRLYAFYYASVLNRPEQAVEYYEKCLDINDSIFSDDVKTAYAQLQTKYETQKKDAEITLLKQEDTIKSLRLKEEILSVQKRNYALLSLSLAILFVIAASYLYMKNQRIRSHRMKELAVKEAEEQERIRLAKDIHDDFGSGLSKIRFLGELIERQSANNAEIRSNVRSISEISSNLVDNMRELVWALDPENTSIDSLVARIREYSSDYLTDLHLPVDISVNGNIPSDRITKEAHRNIFFIVKEALQNIVKHAACSKVKLNIQLHDNRFILIIKDDGKGISRQGSGNGLKNMRHRAGLLGADLQIGPASPGGTELILTVEVSKLIRK